MAVVNGFAGLKLREDGVRIDPFLPKAWNGLTFLFQYHGSRLRFEMTEQDYALTLLDGSEVKVFTPAGDVVLTADAPVVRGARA